MCDVAGCDRESVARGWCMLHYRRWQRNGDPTITRRARQGQLCEVVGCKRPPVTHQLCTLHLARWYKHGNVETVAKGGRKAKPKPSRNLSFVCVVCGSTFLREAKLGRPPVTCSQDCRDQNPRRRAAAWYEANPERVAEYRDANRDKLRAYNLAYYAANRVAEVQRSLAYARGPGREAKRARDAARFALTRGAVSAELFALDEIFSRDDAVCHLCGDVVDRRDATMDHVIPVTRGGPHTRANVKLAHRGCNTRKGNRLLAA